MKDIRIARAPDKVTLKHKRRYCKVEGCCRIVKSQGVCQRHGAKPRQCKVPGCHKQAQGNFKGCCKAHYRALQKDPTLMQKPNHHHHHVTEEKMVPMSQPPVVIPNNWIIPTMDHPDTTKTRRPVSSSEDSSTASSRSVSSRSSTTEDSQDRGETWDDVYLCATAKDNEELAADLLGLFPETTTTTTTTPPVAVTTTLGGSSNGGSIYQTTVTQSQEPIQGSWNLSSKTSDQVFPITSNVPSCNDYIPNLVNAGPSQQLWEQEPPSLLPPSPRETTTTAPATATMHSTTSTTTSNFMDYHVHEKTHDPTSLEAL
jgi:hypothetical protein